MTSSRSPLTVLDVERRPRATLGLPEIIDACLFDLDGVLTRTTELHAAAWKQMFDAFLRRRAAPESGVFAAFDTADDYLRFVDGKTRADGVRSFLASRGIELPEGSPEDPPGVATIHGLGNRKNEIVGELMERLGVDGYAGSVEYVRAARDSGLACAVVSSSVNCRAILGMARIEPLFDAVVDGDLAAERRLRGKPAPDTYFAAAGMLGVDPERSAVFEDAEAGVEAGRSGGFGFVVGVDRACRGDALRRHGADVVVGDLAELLGER